jgi:predicted Zn-dependent peptidase
MLLQGHRHRVPRRTSPRRSTRSAASSDAFTAKEYASYYIKVLDEHLPMAVDLLSDIVHEPDFAATISTREEGHPRRDQDGRGHARRSGPRALHAALLGRAPLGRPILGSKETVESFTAQILRDISGRLRRAEPDRLGAGNVEHAQVRD